MKPGRFTYHAPRGLDEALGLLAEFGDDAKIIAGGQSLMPMLNFRLARIDHLVDINRIDADLATPRLDGTHLTLPALVRQRQVERDDRLADAVPLLREALEQVAHPQIRNRGTVCGSLAHADPAAELPTVMTALGAEFTVVSARGERVIGVDDFFQFLLTTAMEPDELLREVRIPLPGPDTATAFEEFAVRRGDFALAAVAVVASTDQIRVVAAGVAPTPMRLPAVEALVAGSTMDDDVLSAAAAAAAEAVDPASDTHASARYRKRLTGALVRRALQRIRHAR